MGTIAKGEITLSPVNDAYTVSLTPSSCVINTDYSGATYSESFANAHGTITVKRGSKGASFHIAKITKSANGIVISATSGTTQSALFAISAIPNTDVNGWIDFTIVTDDTYNFTTVIRFTYSVIRELSMLDWIQDWDGGKTKIGDSYIMTPKLFVGRKEDVAEEVDGEWIWKSNALTGVYIGPDLLNNTGYGVGVYGYLANQEIFHLNSEGGSIAGWTFSDTGLTSGNGVVNILAEGSIRANNPSSATPYWEVKNDGSAQFANGNVKFHNDGSAEYEGQITAKSGTIGGWTITNGKMYSGRMILDSVSRAIGCFSGIANPDSENGGVVFPLNPNNGVVMYYTSDTDFGIKGRCGGQTVFQVGYVNSIAGWNFNHQAIWTGSETPYLTQGTYATNEDELTVAPNGLRSCKWYIDANGTASFTGGSIKFNTENAEMFGWLMRSNRFSSSHAALISDANNCGLFVSPADISEVSASNLITTITNNGGICIYSNGTDSYLKGVDKNQNVGFLLGTYGTNKIANWFFDHEALYTGYKAIDENTGFATSSGAMILKSSGLIGHMWKLLSNGSGALANGNISWDSSGNVTLGSSVTIDWVNISGAIGDKLTHIDANGIYTGIIENRGHWGLLENGSGYLSSHNIEWNDSGNLTVKGNIQINTLSYYTPATIDLSQGGALINPNNCDDWNGVLPELTDGESRQITVVWPAGTRSIEYMTFLAASSNVKLSRIDQAWSQLTSLTLQWGYILNLYGFGNNGITRWYFCCDSAAFS